MKPTNEQLQQCRHALLAAFDLRDLAQLVRTDLDLALADIAAGDGWNALEQTVGQLVLYYAAQADGLQRLLSAARRQAPTNQALSDLAERWSGLHFDPLPLAPDYPDAGHSQKELGADDAEDGDSLESTSSGDPADMSFSFEPMGPGGTITNTGGGASVGGDAHVGRDLVGRDLFNVGEGAQVVIIQGDVRGDSAGATRGLLASPPKPLIEEAIRLDVATPTAAFVDTPFEIAVAIRQPDAPKLAVAELTEVTSEEGAIFRSADDELISYRVEVAAPGCDVTPTHYVIKLRPGTDSRIYFYHITPRGKGTLSILINAYQVGDDALVAQTRLHMAVSLPVNAQSADFTILFAPLLQDVFRVAPGEAQLVAHQKIVALQMEVSKGVDAQDEVMAGLIQDLVDVAPNIAMSICAIFTNSSLGNLVGPTTRYVLKRIAG
ncbi:MAG: hypothetical protein KDE54_23250 [Caldilineaceae bacterium]|nr:hypothetical protein [Caldilineaceae bacterium]